MFKIPIYFFSLSKYPVLVQKCEVFTKSISKDTSILSLQTCLFVELQEVWFQTTCTKNKTFFLHQSLIYCLSRNKNKAKNTN